MKIYQNRSIKGKVVALQGVGSVGGQLGEILNNNGAKIFFTDINEKNVQAFRENVPQAQFVPPEEIYDVPCEIFSPNALGAVINDQTIDRLRCKIVAGAANNQLKEDLHGKILRQKGILYAPDYLINAGGLMNVSIEFEGWADEKAKRMINTIYTTSLDIFALSDKENIPVNVATDRLAEKRIESIKKIKSSFLGNTSHRFPGRANRRW